jgi:hypothetical protein
MSEYEEKRMYLYQMCVKVDDADRSILLVKCAQNWKDLHMELNKRVQGKNYER